MNIVSDKSKHDISVECSKEGYQSQAESARSSFEAMSLGNIIFGGFIGFGVDLATGATNEYPTSVFVRLMPEQFRSSYEQEAYFAAERDRINGEADSALAKLEEQCFSDNGAKSGEKSDDKASCEAAFKAINDEEFKKKLEE